MGAREKQGWEEHPRDTPAIGKDDVEDLEEEQDLFNDLDGQDKAVPEVRPVDGPPRPPPGM